MPVIVYKTMEVHAVWVQLRRIACDGCLRAFNYLAIGTTSGNTTGVPLLSSDEGMREAVRTQIDRNCKRAAATPRQGEALCPHCQRYQGWMVSRSRRRAWGWGLGLGVLASAVAAVIAWASDAGSALTLGLAVVGPALGSLWGHWRSLAPGPHEGMTDGRAATDEDLKGFLAMCEEKGFEPALAWFAHIGGQFQERVPVIPLPSWDQTAT